MNEPAPETPSDFAGEIDAFRRDCDAILSQVARVIVGHETVVEQVLSCLLGGGHALLEGVPGIGKTLLIRTLGECLDLSFARIQFTPDLMPADITGTNMLVEETSGRRAFEFQRGPIFASLVLADEINRATPKTQSAVLEAMQERTVSAARTTHDLPRPFFVLATQNPLEMEGTYPLPEAQLDRFMLKVVIETPSSDDLVAILDRTTGTEMPHAEKVADAESVCRMQRTVRALPAAAAVKRYIASIILATHPQASQAPPATRKYIRYGASPRGAQSMMLAAKMRALRDGRASVAYEDVRAVAPAALRHRLILSFEAQAELIGVDELLNEILAAVAEPSAE
jgi:MoxR-like ATPase